jgi:hypothetical protein
MLGIPPRFSAPDSAHTDPTTASSGSSASGLAVHYLSGSGAALSPVAASTLPPERPHTCLQSGISKQKKVTDGTIRYAHFCSTGEPSTIAEAFTDSRWKAAMDEEYDALIKNHTWHLVPSARGQNVIDCKWVCKIKRKADGTVDHYKAHLVAKGFKQ